MDTIPDIALVLIVIPSSRDHTPKLFLAGPPLEGGHFNGPTFRRRVFDTHEHLHRTHMLAHEKFICLHCFGCNVHLSDLTPVNVVSAVSANDPFDSEGSNAVMFQAATCHDCYNESVRSRLRDWAKAYVSDKAPYEVGRLRICDWCARAQFAEDGNGGIAAIPPGDTKLLHCSRCQVAYYCDRVCQAKALPKHKPVCTSCVVD